jgi:hypothetical protein
VRVQVRVTVPFSVLFGLDRWALVWIIPWLTGLTVISYLGQYGGTKVIPEGVDLGVVAAFSLLICYVAVVLRLPAHRVAATIAADQRDTPDQLNTTSHTGRPELMGT